MAETTNTNDLRRGMVIDLPDGLFEVVEFQHHKPGKGQAVVRTKIRNLKTGAVLDKTFNSDTKVGVARLDRREMQYLYREDDGYVFMDNETYDQTSLGSAHIDENVGRFLVEGLNVVVAFYDGTPVSLDLPTTVDLKVTKSDPGLKGDRSSAGTKPATVQTGALIQVPLFVGEGETIRVDTRTGDYVTRVQG
ncbi:MAG: elongation factor P [Actinomycetota bacterium]